MYSLYIRLLRSAISPRKGAGGKQKMQKWRAVFAGAPLTNYGLAELAVSRL